MDENNKTTVGSDPHTIFDLTGLLPTNPYSIYCHLPWRQAITSPNEMNITDYLKNNKAPSALDDQLA